MTRTTVPPMPDVPEQCPFCNSGDKREETWQGSPAYSFSCGTVFYANGEVALRYFACYAREKEREERAIREQLTAARIEAERWRERAERLEVELRRVLPLAKGYAAQNPTMENWALCLRADELLKGNEIADITPEEALRGGFVDE